MSEKITAVVPVRAGSVRVKDKNTRPFGDTSLLELKLDVLQEVHGIDEIIVNTDCPISESIAHDRGLTVHRRDRKFADSKVTNDVHWRHLAEVTQTDALLMAQTTSPLVRRKTYEQAIALFRNRNDNFDSVNSVTLEKKFLWLAGRPLNYQREKTPKSQELPDIVSLNFAITLIDRDLMYNQRNVVGYKPRFITLDSVESVDVDEWMDFEFAEFLYQKRGMQHLIEA